MLNNFDELYSKYKQCSEEQKRQNFNSFMEKLENSLRSDLNKAFADGVESGKMENYNKIVNNLKARGMRIFRNGLGDHMIEIN